VVTLSWGEETAPAPQQRLIQVCDSQGMPHKYYHGKTGVVWNVTKRAVGVEIYKQVRVGQHPSSAGRLWWSWRLCEPDC